MDSLGVITKIFVNNKNSLTAFGIENKRNRDFSRIPPGHWLRRAGEAPYLTSQPKHRRGKQRRETQREMEWFPLQEATFPKKSFFIHCLLCRKEVNFYMIFSRKKIKPNWSDSEQNIWDHQIDNMITMAEAIKTLVKWKHIHLLLKSRIKANLPGITWVSL